MGEREPPVEPRGTAGAPPAGAQPARGDANIGGSDPWGAPATTPHDAVRAGVLDENGATHDTVEHLRTRLAASVRLRSTVGAVYADETGQPRSVISVGASGPFAHPEAELDKAFRSVGDETGGVEGLSRRPGGPSTVVTKCGISRAHGRPMTVCGWADQGGMGIAFFPNRGVDESVPLLHALRTAMARSVR